ncbi:MAG: MFS transporter [Bacteroidales bacterium]
MKKTNIYGWMMWFIAALFYALDYFQHTAPSVLIKPIANSAGISFIDVADIMSLYFPVYAISQIPAGYILDKYGVRRILAIACVVVSAGLGLMTLPEVGSLVVGRILIAIGSAFAFLGALKTASASLSARAFPVAVGLTNTIGVLGGILGQPFLNFLIMKFDWIKASLYIVFFGLILAVFIFMFLRIKKVKHVEAVKLDYRSIYRDKKIWFLAIYAGIMVGTIVNAFGELYGVSFLEDAFRLTSEKASLISSTVFIGIAVGGPLHGFIAKKFKGNHTWMIIANIGSIVSFSLIVLSALVAIPYFVLFALYFLTGFFVSSMLLAFSVARSDYPKQIHGAIFALVNMVIGVSGFVFQFMLGKMLKLFLGDYGAHLKNIAYVKGLLILLIPLLISMFLCINIARKHKTVQ